MPTTIERVLIAGATGRTGRHVAAAATARGLTPVALVRDEARAREVLPGVEVTVGDLEALRAKRASSRAQGGVAGSPGVPAVVDAG